MSAPAMSIDAEFLRALLDGESELALFDVREEAAIRESHIFHAAYFPLSWPDRHARARSLVPRLDTLVVLTGETPSVDEDAELWKSWGYTDVRVLNSGMAGWIAAGGRQFRHVCGPSKALAEAGAATHGIRTWSASDLIHFRDQAIASGLSPPLVIDVRSTAEYASGSIPGAVGLPGGELVAQVSSLIEDPSQPIVVTCAFRTRGLLGATSLAWWDQLPNPLFYFHGGTSAWVKAGHNLEPGSRLCSHLSPSTARSIDLRSHPAAAALQYIDESNLDTFLDTKRTTYFINPRLEPGPEQTRIHDHPVRHIPAGQYLEAIDEYTPVYRSRVVLVDEEPHTRAIALARWLRASRLVDAYILVNQSRKAYPRQMTDPRKFGIPPPDSGQPVADALLDFSVGIQTDYTAWSLALPDVARTELGGGFAFALPDKSGNSQ